MINKIKDTIIHMDEKLITIYEDNSCKKKLDISDFKNSNIYYAKLHREVLKEKFFIMYDEEIDNIIDIAVNNNISRDDIFTQFAYYCKSFGGDNTQDNYKVCFPSVETIKRNTFIPDGTVKRYNKLLKENEIILIDNAGMNKKEMKYENTSNVYSRFEDKEYLDKYMEIAKKKVKIKNNKLIDKELQDKQRKLKQLINQYKKDNDISGKYDISEQEWFELQEIEREYYDFVVKVRGKKIKRGACLITIKLDGTDREFYDYNKEEVIHNKKEYKKENTKEDKIKAIWG